MDDGERFKVNRAKGKKWLPKGKGGVDDEVEGYYGNSRFHMKPLKVVFSPYLKRSGFCKREICGRSIEWPMMELIVRKVRMESSKLPIRPPVLLSG